MLFRSSNLHASQCNFFTVLPPKPSIFASSTCRYLRLLASPFDQGLTVSFSLASAAVFLYLRTSPQEWMYELVFPWYQNSVVHLEYVTTDGCLIFSKAQNDSKNAV